MKKELMICPMSSTCEENDDCIHIKKHNKRYSCGAFQNCPECINVIIDDFFNEEEFKI